MDWKKILSKLHFSLFAVVLAIAGFFLFIAAPVQLYDQWVIKSGKECVNRVWNGHHKGLAKEVRERSEAKFDSSAPFENDTGRRFNMDALNPVFKDECHLTVSWFSFSEEWLIEYHRLLNDKNPDPALMLNAGFFFIGLALLLFALKKWTIWLAS